jgi:hypothetical protein
MLSSFPLLPRARSAGRKFGSVALVALVAAFFHLSAPRVEAQGSCSISSTTSTGIVATCNSSDTIQTTLVSSPGNPLSSPALPATNYPDKMSVPYSGTVTGVQVTLKNVISSATNPQMGLFWTQVVLVSPSNHALVFLGGLGEANDATNTLTMTFADGSPSAPIDPPTGTPGHLPSSGSVTYGPTDILNFEGLGGSSAVTPTLPARAPDVPPTLTSASWAQPDGSATFATSTHGVFTGDSAPGNWKLYLADWRGDAVEIQGWSLQLTIDQTAVNTTTSISTAANPATAGNSLTYTATVSSSSGTPAGTVAFYANGVTISGCSAVALSGGVAHCAVSLTAGSAGQCETTTVPAFPTVCQGGQNTIQAKYSGENDSGGDFGASSSSGLVQWIGSAAANITHSGSQWCNSSPLYAPNGGTATAYPSFIPVSATGSPITNVTVQLKGISSTGGIQGQYLLVAPSGHNLDFLDYGFSSSANSAVDLSFADNAGQTPAGGSPISGSYEPYDNNSTGNSDAFSSANPPSPIPGVPTTINYPAPRGSSSNTFASKFSGATASGDWALYLTNQGAGAGSVTLTNGWCVTLTQSTGVATTTTVTSNVPNPAAVGQSVTYTATVKAGSNPVTSGSVTFLDNGTTPTGTNVVSLNSSGQATFTTSSLFDPVNIRSSTVNVLEGDHTITASFGGNSNADPSSGTFLQRIDNPTTLTGSGQNYQACNNTGTTVGVYLGDGNSGPFTPNPSIIQVAGLPGTVNSMKLTLKSFSTFFNAEANSIESLIAGPAGALDFFSKTGGSNPGALTVGDYVFSDGGTSTVPNSTFGPGTYKPTSNSTPDTFTSGYYTVPSFTYATPAGSDTFATKFSNSSPNGTWGLFFSAASHINTAGAAGGWCLNFVQNAVAVSATASHSGTGVGGDFVQNDSSAKITATIANNSGPGPTGAVSGDPLTVTDTLDPAFTYKNSTGSDAGWSCSASGSPVTVTCTDSNQVAQGANSKLVINVNVSSSATGSKSNKISVSGAGVTSVTSASDSIPVDANATLGVSLGHSGTFTQGGQAGEWDITVNNTGAGSTTGTITVTDVLPAGYTLHGSSSTGSAWTCSGPGATTVTCTTSSVIGAGSSSMISLTVNVPADSATSVTNLGASVYGGGDTVHTSLATAATSNTDTVTVNQLTTTTVSPATATFSTSSQVVSLTASVVTGASTPVTSGTVTFAVFNGATQIGSSVTSGTVSGGSAAANYTLPGGSGAGTYSIHAGYNPGSDYTGSSDTLHTLTVNAASTSVALAPSGQAPTLSFVQSGYSGDNSNCVTTSLTCTVSTATSCDPSSTCHPLSQAIGAGHLLIVWYGFEGTATYPVPGVPVCNNSGCGTWVHLSASPSVCTLTTCTSTNVWNNFEIQTGGHMYGTDAYVVYSTTSGSTSITSTWTDPAGRTDVSNADMWISEWACSSACSPSFDVAAALTVLPGTCSSCVGPALTLTGSNDIVLPVAIFSNLYTSISSPYSLMFNDSVAGNAVGYNVNTTSGVATTWGQSPAGGGIFASLAINVGGPQSVTTPFNPSGEVVTVTANVTSGAGIVNEGVVTFTFGDGTPPVALPVSGGSVSALHNYPPVGGVYTVTATYTDSTGDFATSTNTGTVTVTQPPAITSADNTSFQVGEAGTFTVTTTGFPIPALSISSGTLPSGVRFTDNGNGTATLSGTPGFNTNGTYNFTINADNGIAPTPATQTFTLTVNPASILVVDSTGDTAVAADCAVQTDPTLNTGNTSCSLRDALLQAQALGAANIYFYPATFAGSATIPLTNGALAIPANTGIFGLTSGSGANLVTVSAGNISGVFSLDSGLSASLANLIISGGQTSGGGGGLANNGGTLTVSNCAFTGNNSTQGGAIYANGGVLTVQDSTFGSNQATDGSGAGIYVNLGTANISYSTFNNNSSNGSGGGIFNEAGTVTITNSTISGNAATGAPGGGLAINGGTVTLNNSIVAGNTSSTDTDVLGAVAGGSANNLIGDGTGMTGITNGGDGNQVGTTATPINPQLAALDIYGGPTQTMLPEPGSPVICAGAQAGFPSGVTTDQRGPGFANTNTDYSPGTTCVDAGAVQTHYLMSFTTSPPATFNTGTSISPAPVVTLTESGVTAGSATGSVKVVDSAGLLTGTTSESLSGGLATFSDLGISLGTTGDKLTATLPLTGSIDLTADSDSFTTLGPPSLTVAVTHSGTLVQGSTVEWDVTVGDAAGAQPTSGPINLVDTIPSGYTLSSYDSTGGAWACVSTLNTVSCSTSASIATGGTSVIRLMVNVPVNSPILVANTAVASGGGDTLHTGGVSGSDTNVAVQQVAASIAPPSATLSAAVNAQFSSLAVTVTDAGGVPVPGYSVVFTAPGSGASGTFTGGTATVTIPTDASGLADPGAFTANTTAGSYAVTAQGSSLQATFNLTNTAGTLSQLGLSYLPDVFTTWPVTVTVIPEDQYGNALSTLTDSLHFTSSDPNADLPPDGPLCGCTGAYQFQATFKTHGSQTITVTDMTTSLSVPAVASFNVVDPINLVVTTSDDPALFSTECDPQTTPGTGTGVCSLRDALNEASSGLAANITFDTSKMSSTTITLVNGVLEIPNDARIIGSTTSGPITVSGNNASGVFQMTDPTAQGAIDGITITGGFVNDSSPNGPAGPAIYNNGTLWVDSSVITGNNAVSDSELAIGGAIYSDNDLEISNSTITGNTASGGAEALGGGIFNISYLNASNLTVSNNTAESTATGGFGAGGGIFTGIYPFAEMDLDHSTISVNSALGYFDGSGDAAGGGIANIGGEMWMEYNTIAGNSTTFGYFYGGGGVYCQCYQEFYNNTITANTADSLGGGLLLDSGSIMVLSNTIISGNSGPNLADFANYGQRIDLGGNLVHVNGIKLAPLANNGGPAKTVLPLPGSPAICNGLVANIPPGELLDERGFPNVNTLYLAPNSCVDSGAVQTNYSLAFSTQPSPISPATLISNQAPFQAAVTLSESGISGPSGVTIPLTLNGPGTLLGGSATTSAGVANYSALRTAVRSSSDTLTATLPLNGNVTLTQTSSPFAVISAAFGGVDNAFDAITHSSTTLAQAHDLQVNGWAVDPRDGAPVSQVQILIDGTVVGNATLGFPRPSTATAYNNPAYLNSGWTFNYAASGLSLGSHAVTAVALDSLGLSTTLGTRQITVAATSVGAPWGSVDSAFDATTHSTTIAQAHNLQLRGWAVDPQDGAPVSQVQILIDGKVAGNATLGLQRSDVAASYNNPSYLNSGWTFNYAVSGLSRGNHTVTVIAYDSSSLSTTLGTRQIIVATTSVGAPWGGVDSAFDATTHSVTVAQGDNLQVKGWAVDPQDGAPVSQVQILIDGSPVGTATLGQPRTDVQATYNNPAYLNSGWTFTQAASGLSLGSHTITGIAVDSLGLSTTIGTRQITVATTSVEASWGSVDYAIDATTGSTTVAQADNLLVSGWAVDRHDGAPLSQVQILIDGNVAGNATLSLPRPDIAALYSNPAYRNSGWTFTQAASGLSLGAHTVTAIAYDSLSLSTTIGTKTIMVAATSQGPPFGWIDSAVDAKTRVTTVAQADGLLVSGWAVDPQDGAPVSQVQILIDGTPAGAATLGQPRPDVAATYNNPAYLNSGWTFTQAASGLSLGVHTVTVIAYDSFSLSTTIGTKQIIVATTSVWAPFGSVDSALDATTRSMPVAQGDNLQVKGWAVDPQDGAPVSQVQILIDGAPVGTATLGQKRPDVAAAYNNPAYLNSGWTFNYAASGLSLGSHTVTVIALDSLGLSTTLGTKQIAVASTSAGAPFGSVDSALDATTHSITVAHGDKLQVKGWAVDPQDGAPVSQVQILIDGAPVGTATLGQPRPDVAAALNNPAYLNSGWTFNYAASGLSLGSHTVTVIALDSLSLSTTLGTKQITVAATSAGAPFGSVDSALDATTGSITVAQGDMLQVKGWAADPQDSAPVSQVQILIDGAPVGTATLGQTRPDVAAAYNNSAYLNSGWTFAQAASGLSLGSHTVTAIAYDSLGLSTTLGTKQITVATTSVGAPFGSVDSALDATTGSITVAQGDMLQVKGWAADPQDSAPVSQVQVLIDGAPVGTATLGQTRPDVAAAYSNPAYLNSGWTFNYAASGLSLGSHTVTVIAYDLLGLSTTIGTRQIIVATTSAGAPWGSVEGVFDATKYSITVAQADIPQVKDQLKRSRGITALKFSV